MGLIYCMYPSPNPCPKLPIVLFVLIFMHLRWASLEVVVFSKKKVSILDMEASYQREMHGSSPDSWVICPPTRTSCFLCVRWAKFFITLGLSFLHEALYSGSRGRYGSAKHDVRVMWEWGRVYSILVPFSAECFIIARVAKWHCIINLISMSYSNQVGCWHSLAYCTSYYCTILKDIAFAHTTYLK